MIREGLKETFTVKTLVLVLIAVVTYMVCRLVYDYAFSKVAVLRNYPELSDATVMVLGAGLTKGDTSKAVLVGGGISLVNHLGARFRIGWLRVG